MAELEGRGPKVECRRLMDFDDAAKLKMCVLTDSGTGGRCKKYLGNSHVALRQEQMASLLDVTTV